VTKWLALRATGGKSFSQVNPPQDLGAILAGNVSAPTTLGGTGVLFNTANYPNLGVKPEKGWNYNVGAIVESSPFRATVDYYHMTINNILRAQTTAQLVTALVQPGQSGTGALINCSSPLLSEKQSLLGGKPFVVLNGPCVQGQSALSSTGAGGV